MIAVKREVLASGEVKRAEMPLEDPPGYVGTICILSRCATKPVRWLASLARRSM